MRVVAVLAVRNEARFIGNCLSHLQGQGVEAVVIDNASTDDTAAIAQAHGATVETFPFDGTYRWAALLRRKEALFRELDADWFLHVDADEHLLPPPGYASLVDALAAVDARGYDCAAFAEFTFIPTQQHPDHDHPEFARILRSYYPYAPRPHAVRALKKQPGRMRIAWSAGHRVRFDHDPRLSPLTFRTKHYQFLSLAHAAAKYGGRCFDSEEVDGRGWHGWRARLQTGALSLPDASALRVSTSDDDLDGSKPWRRHWLAD